MKVKIERENHIRMNWTMLSRARRDIILDMGWQDLSSYAIECWHSPGESAATRLKLLFELVDPLYH